MIHAPENSFQPLSRQEWREWLQQNHTRDEGIWVVTYKKSSGKPRVEYDEIVEEALCFGWVDSKGNKLDEERSMLWVAPRRKGSNWSGLNKERVSRLLKAGLMHTVGIEKVEMAKKDGTWDALNGPESGEIPEDLKKELKKYPHAEAFFIAFPKSVKRAILEWIMNARKPETRAKRVEETARLAEKNERANQWTGPKGSKN